MRNKVVGIIITAVAVVAVGGVVAWLFVSGRLVWESPSSTVVRSYDAVCDSKIVDTYNDVMLFKQRGDSTELSLDKEGVESLESKVKGLAGNQKDATCQTILFWIAVYHEDYETAKSKYEAVKSLHDKRLFADSNLTGNQPLSGYEEIVYSLSPEGRASEGAGDS